MGSASASAGDSPPPSSPDAAQNNIQHFFVLHKASEKSTSGGKARKRLDLCPTKLKEGDEGCLRMEAFQLAWSGIESSIKDVLRNMNAQVFNPIHSWVCDSFGAMKPIAPIPSPLGTFPIVTHATSCAQLFTALLLTGNMEFVDVFSTFQELGLRLKSHGCYVANLSSLDFSPKNGIAGCLSSLLRQFFMRSFDAGDISLLASWYSQHGNYGSPVVVIINDMERCSSPVLSDFILMLSHFNNGSCNNVGCPKNISFNVLKKLCLCMFTLGSPAERMDAVVEAALVRCCSGFAMGHKVAMFLRNYFFNQDGTLASFIRALKIASVQHFSSEPLSFILGRLLVKEGSKVLAPQAEFLYLMSDERRNTV
ncbi:hypothetical protein C1H46_043639 [Malus baccata]|uniref:Origin recognition complex subunit 3 N-terminal domain-containing protein n=1 Tax=Malus baccata TaxID=106549 RepID=A0A540K9C2_MALBA|nr:hypothetical protein C1H46_043639 [Malus baccata]